MKRRTIFILLGILIAQTPQTVENRAKAVSIETTPSFTKTTLVDIPTYPTVVTYNLGNTQSKTLTNTDTQTPKFTDVYKTDWYYKEVSEMTERKVIQGYLDSTFKPRDNVSWAEYLKMFNMVINPNFKYEYKNTWYDVYLEEAKRLGLIESKNNISPNSKITREEMSNVLYNYFKPEMVESSVFEDTDNLKISSLYEKGILLGDYSQDSLYFRPQANLTRAEVVTLLYRIDNKVRSDRLIVTKDTKINIEGLENPFNKEQFKKHFIDMVQEKTPEREFEYIGIPSVALRDAGLVEEAQKAYEEVFVENPNIFSIYNEIKINLQDNNFGKSKLSVQLTNSDLIEEYNLNRSQDDFFRKTREELHKLVVDGKIKSQSTQREKAIALYNHIINKTRYDNNYNPLSFTGLGVLNENLAVCQGYTAVYVELLRLLGIKAEGVHGTVINNRKEIEHIWVKALLDGKITYIDPTFGDLDKGKNNSNYKYFDITLDELSKTHTLKYESEF